jgi:hypothetical protein
MSDVVFTQEEARQFKAMLLQVQNAAIDLAQKNKALEAELATRAPAPPSPSREGWLTEARLSMLKDSAEELQRASLAIAHIDLKDAIALCDMALSALRPAGDEGWRPIKTAPKVCDPSILVADVKRQDVWTDWWDEDCEWWANSAEYGLSKPTHWMPLPAAPKSPAGGV